MPTESAPDFAPSLLSSVTQTTVSVQNPLGTAAAADTLADRPDPSTATGSFFYATDQDVLYLSLGSSWQRIGLPAGTTTDWYSDTAPDGWVAYDGSDLPASTGIYADLYAHLGGLATPDTKGRGVVFVGTHSDVSTLGNSDGLTESSRTPKHNSTNSLTLPNHVHGPGSYAVTPASSFLTDGSANTGPDAPGSATLRSTVAVSGDSGDPTTNPSIAGTIGPGGTRPTDTAAYIVFGMKIAKL